MKKYSLMLLASIFITSTTSAQIIDSVKKDLLTAPDTVKHLRAQTWALVPPAVLVSYGIVSFHVSALRRLDYAIDNEIIKTDPNFNSKAENYFQYAPVIMVYGLNLAGVSGKNTFVDRTALLGLSYAFMAASVTTVKHTTNRLRPNSVDYLSFPSGHTATAFMGAEFLAQEYSGKSVWYGVAGYTIATATGIFRMYNHDHWFSDVVAGAGFGILSTKLSYLVYPYVRNALTHTDKSGKSSMLMPTYQNGIAGLAFTMQL